MVRTILPITLTFMLLLSISCSVRNDDNDESSVRLESIGVNKVFPDVSYSRMVHMTYPDDGTDRLFLVLQTGQIKVFSRETASPRIFLDISDRISDEGNEEGLLGLAFHPDYSENGYFYTYYSKDSPRRSVLSRFSVKEEDPNQANPNSEVIVMEIPQPFNNHNGGQIVFGPDDYLYIGLGDGGSSGDPNRHGQNLETLLGSILRIDVTTDESGNAYVIPEDNPFIGYSDTNVRQEIWAYGLRNPWKFTFDKVTDQMWAGDVGQNDYEEIDMIQPGLNYGWNVIEGTHCYPAHVENCNQENLEPPIYEYPRSGGNCSVTGGYVYRGSLLPSLHGAYIYGDFCSGRIWALWYDGTHVTENLELTEAPGRISSFGEDQDGEIYVLSFDKNIYRLEIR
ncbi:MAG: PQQ-dependent sugar dehydrogenase [SAR202 cluster bacterium]|nr:PQQ-dependent sugar dehydrogenase [SAR202 cluster bacterium]